jgi:glycosyltransferase involved in cell wall biosynthesis
MRILTLIHEFPPIGGGGGHVAQDIARELIGHGHEVVVLTAHLKGLPLKEIVQGVQIERLPSLRKYASHVGFLAMGVYILAAVRKSLHLIHRWRPDLIHVHFAVPAGAAAWLLSRLTGIPYVLTSHLGDVPGGVPGKTGNWFRWVFPFTKPIWHNAAQTLAVCSYTSTLARQHYGVNPKVIPNGVSHNLFARGKLLVNTPPVVIFAGRFVKQKNLVAMVDILAMVSDLSWKCVMLGDGPTLPDIKSAISSYHMDQRFFLPGWVTPDEVQSWLGKSDILFLPSLSEGLPVVGVQALAKGLAIIASRVGDCVDLVDPGRNGFLVNLGDNKAFSIALRDLLTDRGALLSARQVSLKLARRFNIAAVVDEYETIFRGVIS